MSKTVYTNHDLYRVERKDKEKSLWVEEFATVDSDMAHRFISYRAIGNEEWRIRKGGTVLFVKGAYQQIRVETAS